jgi:uncharacterized protein
LPLSLHEASVAVMVHMLGQLSTILDKAAAHAEAAGLDPATLVEARLAPDMFALARQVQVASDTAKGCAARLAGLQLPGYPDTEASFPELKERIAKTLRFLEGFGPERIDGREDEPVTIQRRDQPFTFSGRDYLLRFALPNFYFHLTTAYDILRQQGVALGKRDFLGDLPASASRDEARPT